MNSELRNLKIVLDRFEREEPYTHQSYCYSALATYDVISIFIRDDNKDAERILRDLLRHRDYRIRSMVIHIFLRIKAKGFSLENETEIRLLQIKNSPIDYDLFEKIEFRVFEEDMDCKAKTAPYN